MNGRPTLADLAALSAIATHRSFRRAADELGLSPSTLSHMMRVLEQNLGVRLLNRTTRSVAPTEAGERLITRLQPLLRGLDEALDEVDSFRGQPSGTLRINASEPAARLLMKAVVPAFLARYPDVALDIVTDGRLIDIVADGFDAGIRLGETVPQDMVAVRFGGEVRFRAVASPAYLEGRTPPLTPDDLRNHVCIRTRMPSGKSYRWEFEKHGEELAVDVPGRLTLDSMEIMIRATLAGLGVAYISTHVAGPYLASGQLVALLDDWSPPIPGLFLYYPGHRHVPGSLRAFIDVLRELN